MPRRTSPPRWLTTWSEQALPLAAFTLGRGALLPQGFPGEWSYWVGSAVGRSAAADRPRLGRVERLQLSLRRDEHASVTPGGYGVEVEWITVGFDGPPGAAARR